MEGWFPSSAVDSLPLTSEASLRGGAAGRDLQDPGDRPGDPAGERPVAAASPSARSAALQVTILLPVFNEEHAIRLVLEEIVEALSATSYRYEILVLDAGSTARSPDEAATFAAACWQCEVRLIRCPLNRGAGAARRIGVREARGEIVVMLDADGTYPAASIPELLRYFPAYDQVNGARTSEQGTLPILRAGAKWFIRQLACYLTGCRIPDLNTGLKAFKRDAMLPWLWVVPNGFSCVTTMTLAFLTNNYAVKCADALSETDRRSKFHPIKDTLSYLGTVLRLSSLTAKVHAAGRAPSAWRTEEPIVFSTGSMQESDIVVLTAGFLTCMLGLLAEVIVAHHRR